MTFDLYYRAITAFIGVAIGLVLSPYVGAYVRGLLNNPKTDDRNTDKRTG